MFIPGFVEIGQMHACTHTHTHTHIHKQHDNPVSLLSFLNKGKWSEESDVL